MVKHYILQTQAMDFFFYYKSQDTISYAPVRDNLKFQDLPL